MHCCQQQCYAFRRKQKKKNTVRKTEKKRVYKIHMTYVWQITTDQKITQFLIKNGKSMIHVTVVWALNKVWDTMRDRLPSQLGRWAMGPLVLVGLLSSTRGYKLTSTQRVLPFVGCCSQLVNLVHNVESSVHNSTFDSPPQNRSWHFELMHMSCTRHMSSSSLLSVLLRVDKKERQHKRSYINLYANLCANVYTDLLEVNVRCVQHTSKILNLRAK